MKVIPEYSVEAKIADLKKQKHLLHFSSAMKAIEIFCVCRNLRAIFYYKHMSMFD